MGQHSHKPWTYNCGPGASQATGPIVHYCALCLNIHGGVDLPKAHTHINGFVMKNTDGSNVNVP